MRGRSPRHLTPIEQKNRPTGVRRPKVQPSPQKAERGVDTLPPCSRDRRDTARQPLSLPRPLITRRWGGGGVAVYQNLSPQPERPKVQPGRIVRRPPTRSMSTTVDRVICIAPTAPPLGAAASSFGAVAGAVLGAACLSGRCTIPSASATL